MLKLIFFVIVDCLLDIMNQSDNTWLVDVEMLFDDLVDERQLIIYLFMKISH